MSMDHYFYPMQVRSSGRFCLTLQTLHMSLQHGKFLVQKMTCPTIIIDHPTCGVHISHPIHTKISPQRFQLSRLNHFFHVVSDKGEQGPVICHGIGGINFPDKMARLAKMQDGWSKRRQTLCVTRSQGQSTNKWWLEDPLMLTLRIIGDSSNTGYPPPHRLKYLTSY